jgi:hypothetical protein
MGQSQGKTGPQGIPGSGNIIAAIAPSDTMCTFKAQQGNAAATCTLNDNFVLSSSGPWNSQCPDITKQLSEFASQQCSKNANPTADSCNKQSAAIAATCYCLPLPTSKKPEETWLCEYSANPSSNLVK